MDDQKVRSSFREIDEKRNKMGNIVTLCCLPKDTQNFSYRSGRKASTRVCVKMNLTPTLSELEIQNDATLRIQNWFVFRVVTNIFHKLLHESILTAWGIKMKLNQSLFHQVFY